MHTIWRFITDFGDTAVTVPLAVVMLGFLAGAREQRMALGWAAGILFCVSSTAYLKMLLFACGYPLGPPMSGSGLASPSGHVAMSTVVYGGFAAVVAPSLARRVRILLFAGAAALIVAIAVSRPVLGFHSVIEVGVGFAFGTMALTLIAVIVARCRPSRLAVVPLAATALAVALLFHGTRWPAEDGIHHIAYWAAFLFPWCR